MPVQLPAQLQVPRFTELCAARTAHLHAQALVLFVAMPGVFFQHEVPGHDVVVQPEHRMGELADVVAQVAEAGGAAAGIGPARVDGLDAAGAKVEQDIAEAEVAVQEARFGRAGVDRGAGLFGDDAQRGRAYAVEGPAGVEVAPGRAGVGLEPGQGLVAVGLADGVERRRLFQRDRPRGAQEGIGGTEDACPDPLRQASEDVELVQGGQVQVFELVAAAAALVGAPDVGRQEGLDGARRPFEPFGLGRDLAAVVPGLGDHAVGHAQLVEVALGGDGALGIEIGVHVAEIEPARDRPVVQADLALVGDDRGDEISPFGQQFAQPRRIGKREHAGPDAARLAVPGHFVVPVVVLVGLAHRQPVAAAARRVVDQGVAVQDFDRPADAVRGEEVVHRPAQRRAGFGTVERDAAGLQAGGIGLVECEVARHRHDHLRMAGAMALRLVGEQPPVAHGKKGGRNAAELGVQLAVDVGAGSNEQHLCLAPFVRQQGRDVGEGIAQEFRRPHGLVVDVEALRAAPRLADVELVAGHAVA